MKDRYWFKARKTGYGWVPSTWQGWLVIISYIVATVHSFVLIYSSSPTLSAMFANFLPRVLIFSALLTIITYLMGEPVTRHFFGGKRKPEAP